MMKKKFVFPAVAATLALALTGCVNNSDSEGSGNGKAATETANAVQVDAKAAAALPESFKKAGKLRAATDASYQPNEFKDASGKPTGWSVALTEAIGKRLGVPVEWEVAEFDSIIPKVQGGTVDLGDSSMTDNAERQKSVTFVDYYNAGIQWTAAKGKTVDPKNACGLKVSVQTGTLSEDEVKEKAETCKKDGKPALEVLKFDDQAAATTALLTGKADAMSADSPIVGAAVAASNGQLVTVSDITDASPYGFAVAKDKGLDKAVQLALQSLIDDGTYGKILKQYNVESGAIKKTEINGGK